MPQMSKLGVSNISKKIFITQFKFKIKHKVVQEILKRCVWRGSSTRDLHVKVYAPTQLIFTCSNSRIEIEPLVFWCFQGDQKGWHSWLGNYIACKRFAVQTLWSLEFVMRQNFEHNTIAVSNLARSWSISGECRC